MRELLMKLGLGKFIQYYEKYFGERKTPPPLRSASVAAIPE